MKKFYLLSMSFLLLFIATSQSGYWRHSYHQSVYGEGMNATEEIVGDSSSIFAFVSGSQLTRIMQSTDCGKSWNTFYHKQGWDQNDFPGETPYGIELTENYLYVIYSESYDYKGDVGIGILKLDGNTGERLDSTVLQLNSYLWHGDCFKMYDDKYGILFANLSISITHDGWETWVTHDIRDGDYNEDSTDYFATYQHDIQYPVFISKDTLFSKAWKYSKFLQSNKEMSFGFQLFIIEEGDSVFHEIYLGDGINIEYGDSIIHLTTSHPQNQQKRPVRFAYINDSTWLYQSAGKKTGYGQCKTLEIFKTTNRGETYRQVCNMDINAFGLSDIVFKDEMNGVAGGNSGILTTSDGGETWQVEEYFYNEDWSEEVDFAIWAPSPSYIEDMLFMGVFARGVFKYEETFGASVDDKQSEPASCLVYPNPSVPGEMLNFKLSKFTSGEAFVYDLYGKKVQQVGYFGNSFRLREDIAPGTYLVCLMSGGKVVARESINVK